MPATVPDSASRRASAARVSGSSAAIWAVSRPSERGEDLGEVGAQPGAEPVPGQGPAGPDVEEVGAPAVGQGVPQPDPAEQLEHGQLLGALVVPGGGAAVGDERAAGREQAPGVDAAAPADVVEDGVHPAGGEFADPGGDVAAR